MGEQFSEYNPPHVQRPEVAKVSVGFNPEGHLSVRVLATRSVEMLPGLRETFDRASAAFMKAFAADNQLLQTVKGSGTLSEIETLTKELAQRDGAVQVGYDGPTDVNQPKEKRER